jgi:rhodanese-related sulfurtransferase
MITINKILRYFHFTGIANLTPGLPGILIFLFYSCGSSNPVAPEISAVEFMKTRDRPNTITLDVRTKGEYERGHLTEAILIDIYAPGAPDKLRNLDKSKTYFVYCHSGVRSRSIVNLMRDQGFENAYNIRGGIISLARSGATFSK